MVSDNGCLPPRVGRREAWGLLGAGALASAMPAPALAADVISDAAAILILNNLLHVNLLPFWRRICDRPAVEGYELNVDATGQPPLVPSLRRIIPQTRTTWFFAHLARSGRGQERDLAIATHGFRYLTDHMWDDEHGGFFGVVNPTTDQPTTVGLTKLLVEQAHGLLALSEYAQAMRGRPEADEARARAVQMFETIVTRLRDPATGDYRDALARDWTELPPTPRSFNGRFRLVDALTAYYELEPSSGERLVEAIALAEQGLVEDNGHFHSRETDAPASAASVSYLADLQIIHQLRRARAVLGRAAPEPGTFRHVYRRVLDDALRWGEDYPAGGFFEAGSSGVPASDRRKINFTQAEALLGLCDSWVRTRDPQHGAGFGRMLLWIAHHQADRVNGDWYPTVLEGVPTNGPKGAPFHTGRSVLRSLELLEA